jgi:hypothetical protein
MADLGSFERTRFHTGQLLTAEDFMREQEYLRDKLKRHNRSLHGFGVVFGLKVIVAGAKVVIDPGLALDCAGNEIAIGTPQLLSALPSKADSPVTFVNIRYAEVESGEAKTIESFEICFAQENFSRGHRHLRARWLACGECHPVTIAKLRYSSQGWRVDRRYRPPVIK